MESKQLSEMGHFARLPTLPKHTYYRNGITNNSLSRERVVNKRAAIKLQTIICVKFILRSVFPRRSARFIYFGGDSCVRKHRKRVT